MKYSFGAFEKRTRPNNGEKSAYGRWPTKELKFQLVTITTGEKYPEREMKQKDELDKPRTRSKKAKM